ncbi:hydrogen peroxide-dependent heme synthase [Rhodococcus koreensis]|uniref:hydrogen peroxide-dependent heme synthase n=1 Tax=Rhodococcus koreensis TaxID=99653 RepID=UPI00198064CE|nr:hydrogen peroxide-dependent heme synthase [Rhodococcus koreensis]QSE85062.1 chlorite dismutase family protein [Rhodococcus koreensis]
MMFTVFQVVPGVLPGVRAEVVEDARAYFEGVAESGVVLRGICDVAGLRADADFMIWTHADTVEGLQAAYSGFRRCRLGRACTTVWSAAALHRPAEFNRSHIAAYVADEEPGQFVCVYPFNRSLEWYLLPDVERRRQLAEHGRAARAYPDVRANTVSSFGLSDYEWILAFEAPDPSRIVDMMRDLRATDARRHVRLETPFFSGPRTGLDTLVARLP